MGVTVSTPLLVSCARTLNTGSDVSGFRVKLCFSCVMYAMTELQLFNVSTAVTDQQIQFSHIRHTANSYNPHDTVYCLNSAVIKKKFVPLKSVLFPEAPHLLVN